MNVRILDLRNFALFFIYEEALSASSYRKDVCVPLQEMPFFASELCANNGLAFWSHAVFKRGKKCFHLSIIDRRKGERG